MDLGINWNLMHPVSRQAFSDLADDLAKCVLLGMAPNDLRPFEGYRPPDRQAAMFAARTSVRAPWCSAHQFGLALDFQPWRDGRWVCASHSDCAFLTRCARARGLVCRLEGHRLHVESPLWTRARLALASSSDALAGSS